MTNAIASKPRGKGNSLIAHGIHLVDMDRLIGIDDIVEHVETDGEEYEVNVGKGLIVYEGPSMLNGEPIVAILTPASKNKKTGDMAQLWILAKDIDPVEAVKSGADESICGTCPARGGYCYVNIGRAPLAVWRAYSRGGRYVYGLPLPVQKAVRLGAYGDPAALPFEIIAAILAAYSEGNTGYTHQWRECDSRFKAVVMASTETIPDSVQAESEGWRVARVGTDATLRPNEFLCPATDEGGKRVQCVDCMLCSGNSPQSTPKGTLFPAHGSRKKLFQIAVAA